ncbi:hypothetical protein J1605_020566 [Eschrichtius robustus]|uniref:Uncharacterized protein n=1 Tax=Eschrichtius robustus TaxID=9764 RepID=A0AB34HJS9_ESCRO|nr:hypothetical protein J1605_020566 [Eschrichtius robustus]
MSESTRRRPPHPSHHDGRDVQSGPDPSLSDADSAAPPSPRLFSQRQAALRQDGSAEGTGGHARPPAHLASLAGHAAPK